MRNRNSIAKKSRSCPRVGHDIHEECGVFGVFNHPEASNLTYLGLYALQHRGQEGAGICSSDGKQIYLEKAMGLVADIFSGAYSLLILREKELIAVRDPYGVRPLCLGQVDGAYVVASETCALDLINATYLRDVEPGEMLIINENGLRSVKALTAGRRAHCIFEFIYFSRPDSYIFGYRNVNEVRKEFGRQLARELPVEADIVIPVPDSGVPAAIGFSEESGIHFDFGLIRNHYVGRTFIEPKQSIRHFGVKIKLNPVRQLLEGKRVVVVDDSIVRGTTSKKIVKMLREVGGAKEVHMRISSPPTLAPCFYGIDTPTRQELIAYTHMIEETRKYITADTLAYLSLEGLKEIVPDSGDYCSACFDNEYPIHFPGEHLEQMELIFR